MNDRPAFECEKCKRPVGAKREGETAPWEPASCYWCAQDEQRRDAARRRKLGHVAAGIDLDKALAAYRKHRPFKGNLGRVELQVAHRSERGTRGTAWINSRRIRIAVGPNATPERVLEVLVHEMCHLACPQDTHHGERFRRVFQRACRELWGIEVPLDAEPRQGNISYGMGDLVTAELHEKIHLDEIDLEPFAPDAPKKKITRAEATAKLVEKREAHALKMHKKALTRLKRAKTAEAKWRKKVAYYERKAAKAGG